MRGVYISDLATNVKRLVLATSLLSTGATIHWTFEDVASQAGLTRPVVFGSDQERKYILESTGTGVAFIDFDGDGRNDLFFPNGSTLDAKDPPIPLLYRNEGGGGFREMARETGLVEGGWAQAACAGDIDNDGKTDLFVTYYGTNRLYRNTGSKFEDVTRSKGLAGAGNRWGAGCALVDYDRDGRLDIFVSNYVDFDLKNAPLPGSMPDCIWKGLTVFCGPRGLPMARNALYHQRTDGTFEDVSERAGILKPGGRYGLGTIAADFNNDGWPDIYVACDQTPSQLYHNNRNGTFTERGIEAGVAYNFDGRLQSGMGVAVGDFDRNGYLDIVKTNFSGDLPSLYLNEDGSFFRDVSQQAGLGAHQLLGWGVAFADFDEDGFPDLVMANGHVYPEVDRSRLGDRYRQLTLIYRNLGNGKFADQTAHSGPAFEIPRPARGLATGDLDDDGYPEVVIANMNQPPSLLKNKTVRQNWIRIELTGRKSNRSAIGARVTVTSGGRIQMNEVRSGDSYYSTNELALHFGLGTSQTVDRVEVRWPSGLVEHWEKPAVKKTHRLVEATGTPTKL